MVSPLAPGDEGTWFSWISPSLLKASSAALSVHASAHGLVGRAASVWVHCWASHGYETDGITAATASWAPSIQILADVSRTMSRMSGSSSTTSTRTELFLALIFLD